MIPIGSDLTQYAFGPAQNFFATQPGVPTQISPLAPTPPSLTSPFTNPAERQAMESLVSNLAPTGSPTDYGGTPGSSPAPNAGGFNSASGLGTLGGFAGSAIGGPLGGAFGRGIGSGIGAMADAARANSIAETLGIGQVSNPASAFGQAAGRSAAQSAASLGLSARGLGGIPGLGAVASRAFGGMFGGPSFGTDIGLGIANAVNNRADLETALDREDMALGMNMRANAMTAAPRSDVAYGMAADFGSKGNEGASADAMGSSNENSSPGQGDSEDGGAKAGGGLVKPTDGRVIPLAGGGKIAMGPGGGLDDLIPTTIDGSRAAALSDGEFVIPADVVSMMGDGSSNAGSQRLYDLVRSIREHKTGTEQQAGPLPVGDILKRIAAR